nr:lipid II flippase MurJ [uncultured Psychroserpens sp.]
MNLKFDLKSLISNLLKNATITNVITVGITTLIVSGFGFLKDIVIADSFGLSELIDTFYIAILVPSFISGVFLGSFNSVFIPNYVSELKTGKHIGAFQSTSFILTIGVAIFFLIIAFLFTDTYLELLYEGHTASYYELIKKQFYFVAPCILFWGFSSVISGLLTIDNEFKYSSISTIFTPISIILALLLFKDYLGDVVLAVGTLIGSILNFIFILGVAIKRGVIHLDKPDFKSHNVVKLFKQLPAKLSSSLLSGINPLIDQFFSQQLVIGSIAALGYGIKIPMFAIGIVGAALGNVLLPYFSKYAIDNPEDTFIKLKQILKYLILGGLVIVIIGVLLSYPVISILFERNAFTSNDTAVVSKIQQMYLLQIPSYVTGLVMVKFLTSINRNNIMVITSIIGLLLNITLNYFLIDIMGVYGLALATSLVSIMNSIVLYIYISKINKIYV